MLLIMSQDRKRMIRLKKYDTRIEVEIKAFDEYC